MHRSPCIATTASCETSSRVCTVQVCIYWPVLERCGTGVDRCRWVSSEIILAITLRVTDLQDATVYHSKWAKYSSKIKHMINWVKGNSTSNHPGHVTRPLQVLISVILYINHTESSAIWDYELQIPFGSVSKPHPDFHLRRDWRRKFGQGVYV